MPPFVAVATSVLLWAVLGSTPRCAVSAQRDSDFLQYVDYFWQPCPEGCRDIDKYVSCGSVTNFLYCNLAQNGNVTMVCSDGKIYSNSYYGCQTELDPAAWESYLNGRFDLRTVYRFMYVFEKFYNYFELMGPFTNPAYLTISVIEGALCLYFLVLAVRLEKVTRIICGAVVGELIAMVALAAFNVTLNTYTKGVPLYVLPIAVGIVAAVWRRVVAFLTGFGMGFVTGVVMAVEVYSRAGRPIDKDVFYLVACMTAFFTVIAQPMKKPMLLMFVSTFSALSGTACLVQLAGTFIISPTCVNMASGYADCAGVGIEGVFLTLWVLTFASQVFTARHLRKKKLRQILRSHMSPMNDERMPVITDSAIDMGTAGIGLYGATD